MSFLRKIINSDGIKDGMLIKNGFLSVGRYYSRSDSKYSDLRRRIARRDDIEDDSYNRTHICDDEGGPWEVLCNSGNRFYLPDSLGPAWYDSRSVANGFDLNSLVDFNSKESNKLHFSRSKCPMLLQKDLRKLFPSVRLSKDITIITLYYPKHTEVDDSAKNFVLAASELCMRLKAGNFWADFINPFSGKPFFENDDLGNDPFKPFVGSQKKLFTVDERFRGPGVKVESRNNCLVISSDMHGMFSGSLFTNAGKGAESTDTFKVEKFHDYSGGTFPAFHKVSLKIHLLFNNLESSDIVVNVDKSALSS